VGDWESVGTLTVTVWHPVSKPFLVDVFIERGPRILKFESIEAPRARRAKPMIPMPDVPRGSACV
jgi:hypothetical protein